MLLKKIKIKKLHENFDYNLKFNKDINLLYGLNGTGKTTILNIIQNILNFKFENLFRYNFSLISLEFSLNNIILNIEKAEESKLRIFLTEEKKEIFNFEFCKELRGEFTSNYKFNKNEKRKIQSNDYLNLIEYLKEKVKLLSIPLNRHKDLIELKSEDYDNFTQTLTFGMKKDIKDIDTALKNVKDELYHNYNEIINENKKEEENLRTDILQQLIKDIINLNNLIDVDIKAEKEKKSSEKVENSENKAKKPIKNQKKNLIKNYEVLINEYSDENLIKNIESIIKIDLSKQIKILCNYFQKQIENINEIDNDENVFIFMHKINFNIIDRDIRRYKKIINSIKKYNERINHKIKKFNLLKEILNSFLVDTGKEIKIDTGEIRVFNIKNKNKINLKNLSSGEKHIILFFCEYLSYFYNLKDGIFIIDEPEISLHINWQELLVKSINEINSNIQLLFATHSPYIIANFTEKMIEIKI